MRNKILIVDDEPDILDVLKYNLEKEGFEVQKAKNGKRSIEKAYSFNPDLILLDIMMPQMDGIEVCRKLREDSKFAQTYIVFLTARSEEYSEVAGFDVGRVRDHSELAVFEEVNGQYICRMLRRFEKVLTGFNMFVICVTKVLNRC